MRTLTKIYIMLLSFMLITACAKEKLEEVVYEIPAEDRCVFTEGDVLLYSCSNGSTDTVVVRNVDFITESGTYTVWGADMHNYITETQNMLIETTHDNWKYEKIDSRCFSMNSLPKYDDINTEKFPWCLLLNGCEYTGSKVIAQNLAVYDEIPLNDKSYKKVYYQSSGDMNNGYEIYWNLKYGIIRFVGMSSGTNLIWQLED